MATIKSITGGAGLGTPAVTITGGGKKKGGGSGVGHFLNDIGTSVVHMGEDFVTGAATGTYILGKHAVTDPEQFYRDLGAIAKQPYYDLRHPLRNKLNTALDVGALFSGGASLYLRGAEAARAVEALRGVEGVTSADRQAAAVKALVTNPAKTAVREITVPPRVTEATDLAGPVTDATGMTVRGHYSRAGGSHLIQRTVDEMLQGSTSRTGQRILQRRAAKWNRRNMRSEGARLRINGIKAQVALKKLSDGERGAVRLVAEGVNPDDAIRAASERATEARGQMKVAKRAGDPVQVWRWRKQARALERHQSDFIDAKNYLTTDEAGFPIFHDGPEAAKAADAFHLGQEAIQGEGGREQILQHLDLLDEHAMEQARIRTAGVRAGGHIVSEQEAAQFAREAGQAGRRAERKVEVSKNALVRQAQRDMVARGDELTKASRVAERLSTATSPEERVVLADIKRANRDFERASRQRRAAEGGRTTIPAGVAEAGVEPRLIPVKRDPFSNYSSPDLPIDEFYGLMPKGDYLYHSTTPENLGQIRRSGLAPGKERRGEPTGVYLAEDGVSVHGLRPGNARPNDVILRVRRGDVRTQISDMYEPGSGFAEHYSPETVPAKVIEYLGHDNQWHSLTPAQRYEAVHAGEAARRLLQREQDLAKIRWQRYSNGEINAADLERGQRRLTRITDAYEKHAASLQTFNEAKAGQEDALTRLMAGKEKLGGTSATAEDAARAAREAESKARAKLHVAQAYAGFTHAHRRASIARAAKGTEAAMQAALDRAGTVAGAEGRLSPYGFHIGNPPEGLRRRIRQPIARPSSSRTLGHVAPPVSLRYSTGQAIERGTARRDLGEIINERVAEALHLQAVADNVELLKGVGTKVPTSKDDAFMWTDKIASRKKLDPKVSQFLKNPEAFMNETPEAQTSRLNQVKDMFFAKPKKGNWETDVNKGELNELKAAAERGEGVFIPKILAGDMPSVGPMSEGWTRALDWNDKFNNAQKAALIYMKLNYVPVQGLSNIGMNFLHQGFLAGPNLARASRLSASIGPDLSAMVDEIVGSGFFGQLALKGREAGWTTRLAHAQGMLADLIPRRAAFIHEARKAGFKSKDDMELLITDDRYAGDLAEVAQRAKEAIVDFGDLRDWEKKFMTRLVFIYPWLKGSTKYAGHFLRDHPVQSAVLSHLGEYGGQINDQRLGPRATYAEGLLPFGANRVFNTTTLNPFSTPVELARTLTSTLGGGRRGASPAESLAPSLALLTAIATRRNDFGQPVSGNLAKVLRAQLVESIPAVGALRAPTYGHQGVLADTIRALLGSRYASNTYPDVNDPYFRFLLGGLYPRRFDKAALNKAAGLEGL